MTTDLGRCSHCNGDQLAVYAQPKGRVTSFYDQNGNHIEDSTDKIYFERSMTVRCADCLRIRQDLFLSYRNKILRRQDV